MKTILDAALDYVHKRIRARELKRARNAIVCENQEEVEESAGFGECVTVLRGTPCWQQTELKGGTPYEPAEPMLIDPADYCEKCKERQGLHEAYHKAARAQAGAYQRLERRVKK